MSEDRYVPAAGGRLLTPFFDPVMRVTTREWRWRGEVVDLALAPSPATLLDVGCGTGTLALQLARRAPDARVIGLDGDPEILTRAAAKAQAIVGRSVVGDHQPSAGAQNPSELRERP
jgi:ubiquinone/menaquinone biosynthesis C-methylase UbiE